MVESRKHLLMVAAALVLGIFVSRVFSTPAPALAQSPATSAAGASWVLLHHDTGAGQTIPLWVNLEQANSIRFEDPTPGSGKPKANVVLSRQIAIVNDPQEIELLRRYVLERQRK